MNKILSAFATSVTLSSLSVPLLGVPATTGGEGPLTLVFPEAPQEGRTLGISSTDPLGSAVEARMHERLLKNADPERVLAQVPPGVDSLAILQLSKERLGAEFQREVEELILESPTRTSNISCLRIAEVFRSTDPICMKAQDMTKVEAEIKDALTTQRYDAALAILHDAVQAEYAKGFMTPPAPVQVWESAGKFFAALKELSPTSPRETIDSTTIQLLAALDQIFPGHYMGAERTKLLSTNVSQRLASLTLEAEFFSSQQRRAFP